VNLKKKEKKKVKNDKNEIKSQESGNKGSIFGSDPNLITPDQCRDLTDLLVVIPLPGLFPKEQVYLLAILDTLTKLL